MVSVFIKKLLDGIYESCIWHEHIHVYGTLLQNLFGFGDSEFGKKMHLCYCQTKIHTEMIFNNRKRRFI